MHDERFLEFKRSAAPLSTTSLERDAVLVVAEVGLIAESAARTLRRTAFQAVRFAFEPRPSLQLQIHRRQFHFEPALRRFFTLLSESKSSSSSQAGHPR